MFTIHKKVPFIVKEKKTAILLPLAFISRISKPLQKGSVLLMVRNGCIITITKMTSFWSYL